MNIYVFHSCRRCGWIAEVDEHLVDMEADSCCSVCEGPVVALSQTVDEEGIRRGGSLIRPRRPYRVAWDSPDAIPAWLPPASLLSSIDGLRRARVASASMAEKLDGNDSVANMLDDNGEAQS